MRVYTNTFDLSRPSPRRFWVAPFSEFKIGVKILADGQISDKDFTLKAGSVEFTPDADKIDNFTLFTIKSNDTGFVEYTVEVEGVAEKLKLVQIVTDSTVFEIDASGGDVPADVATQTWVNSQISDFVDEDALTAYATKGELTAYAETADLTAYAEKTDLTAYYTKSETSSATELADAFANVGGGITPEDALYNNINIPNTVCLKTDGSISAYNIAEFSDLTSIIGTDNKQIVLGS